MPSQFSSMLENAFEQWLSSDANRIQRLASRELQNLIRDIGLDVANGPINGLLGAPPTLTGIAATFSMTLGAGQGFFSFPTDPNLTADDSSFEVLRWAGGQTLTFANPNLANPRIDLVCVAPGQETVDSVVRNILTDPTARTVTATPVFKTTNPKATITVVQGSASAAPVPPAVPGGSVALFEVWIPAAAADATAFTSAQRLFRLAHWPNSRANGILSGCRLIWVGLAAVEQPFLGKDNFVNDTAAIIPGHAVVIDGEVIEFSSAINVGGQTFPQLKGDGNAGNDPFVTAGPGGDAARPYYVYLVGGRHSPQFSGHDLVLGINGFVPVVMVASTVPPDLMTGHPTAAITTPRGDTTILGAVYIGMGFTKPGTTDSISCVMDEDWVHSIGFKLDLWSIGGPFPNSFTLSQIPPFSRQAMVDAVMLSDATAGIHITELAASLNGVAGLTQKRCVAGPSTEGASSGPMFVNTQNTAKLFAKQTGVAAGGDTGSLFVVGYTHHVPRLDGYLG